ncbi:Regulator of RpoS [Paenibacillus sp. JJ-223]|nr:Regulator of RpoS [Paenibacillus sp. JJ-223]
MFSVTIVDDEPKLRLGLQTLIPWKDLGFEVMGTAAGGNEALRMFEEKIPDVLLVDIRMPGMDGLELLQEIRLRGWHIHVIILSGYADFEYARQALQFGVEAYLLKPVNKEELSALLQKIHGQLSAKKQEKSMVQKTNSPEWILYSLLSGRHDSEDSLLKEWSGSFQAKWTKYQILLIGFPGSHPEESERIHSFKDVLSRTYTFERQGIVLYFAPYIVLLLGDPPVGDYGWTELHKNLQLLSGELRFEMDVAVGQPVRSLDEILHSFRTARSLLERSFFYDKGRLLTEETPESYPKETVPSPALSRSSKEEEAFRLHYLVDVGHAETISSFLDEIALQQVVHHAQEKDIRDHFFYLANETVRKIHPRIWSLSGYPGEPARFLAEIYNSRYIRELVGHVSVVMEKLARCSDYNSKDNEMKRLLDYIDRHYGDNLRLEMLAVLFNYSSSYLGQLFKSYTGEYFNAYLDRIRIQKAKEMLAQDMKVYEVAEKVGYSNVNYFHTKFKKLEGKSPSFYQKKE